MTENLRELLDVKTKERIFAKALAVVLIYIKELGGSPDSFKEWVKKREEGASEEACLFAAVEIGRAIMDEVKAEQDTKQAIDEARGKKPH